MARIALLVSLGGMLSATEAVAQESFVSVVQVSGRIDPIVAEFLADQVSEAQRNGAEVLVLQLDSPGALVDETAMGALLSAVTSATVPVAVWIGPSGSEALGEAGRLVEAADVAGMARGTRLQAGPKAEVLDSAEALELGLIALGQEEAAVLGTFIASLDGLRTEGGTAETARFTPVEDGPPTAELTVQTRLVKLDLGPRLLHGVASPQVAYLLLSAGLVLLVFELFTGGVGVAGGVGVVSLFLASFGLGVLPTSPLGLVLMLIGLFGLSVDVQTGAPRVWTAIGVISYGAGSLLLFGNEVRVGWLAFVSGMAMVILIMLAGLPATVRSRYSTPTIGRQGMIGQMGSAEAALRPEGVVRVAGALWPARTNRSTPIAAGEPVRVVGIAGWRLEVEPESGGAKDYHP